MSDDCKHDDLKRTADTTDDGTPIYYCAAKCGAGMFVVEPLQITGHFDPRDDWSSFDNSSD